MDGDTRPPALLLLSGPLAPPGGPEALAAALRRLGPVVVPGLQLHPERPADLETPASAVLAALAASGAERGLLCGVGLGALVALQVAADQPGRVAGLVLSTQLPALGGAVRSVSGGVAGLLPASTLQRLSRRSALIVLEQVRGLEYRPLVRKVRAPALVLHGGADPDNARASQRLAASLPSAEVRAVPGAGPGWVWREPGRWAEAATPFLTGRGRAA